MVLSTVSPGISRTGLPCVRSASVREANSAAGFSACSCWQPGFPLVLLGCNSLRMSVSRLKLEATDRLAARAKIAGLAIFGRLESLRSDLAVVAAGLAPADRFVDLLAKRPSWRDRFAGLFLTSGLEAPRSWQLPELGAEIRAAAARRVCPRWWWRKAEETAPAVWVDLAGESPAGGTGLGQSAARVDLAGAGGGGGRRGGVVALSPPTGATPSTASPDLPAGLLDPGRGETQIATTQASNGEMNSGREVSSLDRGRFRSGSNSGHSGLMVLMSEPNRLWDSIDEIRRSLSSC